MGEGFFIRAGTVNRVAGYLCAAMCVVTAVALYFVSTPAFRYMPGLKYLIMSILVVGGVAILLFVRTGWRVDDDGVAQLMLVRKIFYPWDKVESVRPDGTSLVFTHRGGWSRIVMPLGDTVGEMEAFIAGVLDRQAERRVEEIEKGARIQVLNRVARESNRMGLFWLVLYGGAFPVLLYHALLDTPDREFDWVMDGLKLAACGVCFFALINYLLRCRGKVRLNAWMDSEGIWFAKSGEMQPIKWSDVVVEIDHEAETSASPISSQAYKISSASDPGWEFTLRDSMMNYHAARLLLRRRGLLAE